MQRTGARPSLARTHRRTGRERRSRDAKSERTTSKEEEKEETEDCEQQQKKMIHFGHHLESQ